MKSIRAALAAATAVLLSSQGVAAPIIGFVDNMDNSVTLQISPDPALLPGSLGTETALSVSGVGVSLTGATIANPTIWDTPNPGDSPFIPGSPITGDAFGLDLSGLALNQIFAAYGSATLSTPGPTDFLTITYSGSGTLQANGLVAQMGQNFDNLSASIDVGDAGTGLPTIRFVDNGDGTVTLQIVTTEVGSTATELAFEVQVGEGLSIDNAFVAGSVYGASIPGNNPFTGGITRGLYADFANNQVFGSFGSSILGAGAYDFLTLEVSGEGTLLASGAVAQLGMQNSGLTASIGVVPEPSAVLLTCLAMMVGAVPRRV